MGFYEAIIPLFGIVFTFFSLTAIFYTYFTTRNKERLALIAKDKTADIWKKKKSKNKTIKIAFMLVGFGTACVFGAILQNAGLIDEDIIILGLVPIFMGGGLLLSTRFEDEDDIVH